MTRPPDRQREHQANERTFLAWLRTSIALIGFGFAIARFGLFLRQLRVALTHNWLRVSYKVDPKYRATKVRLSHRRGKMLCFDVLVALFPNILVSKARQFWVSLAETSKGMDVKGVSFGRNAAD